MIANKQRLSRTQQEVESRYSTGSPPNHSFNNFSKAQIESDQRSSITYRPSTPPISLQENSYQNQIQETEFITKAQQKPSKKEAKARTNSWLNSSERETDIPLGGMKLFNKSRVLKKPDPRLKDKSQDDSVIAQKPHEQVGSEYLRKQEFDSSNSPLSPSQRFAGTSAIDNPISTRENRQSYSQDNYSIMNRPRETSYGSSAPSTTRIQPSPTRLNQPLSSRPLLSNEIPRSSSGIELSQPVEYGNSYFPNSSRRNSESETVQRPERLNRMEGDIRVVEDRRRDSQNSSRTQSRSREASYQSIHSSNLATPSYNSTSRPTPSSPAPVTASPTFFRNTGGFSPDGFRGVEGDNWKKALSGYRTPVTSPSMRSPLSNSMSRIDSSDGNQPVETEAFNRMRIQSHQSNNGRESKRTSVEHWSPDDLNSPVSSGPVPFATSRRMSNSFSQTTSYDATDPSKQLFIDGPNLESLTGIEAVLSGLPTPPSSMHYDVSPPSVNNDNEHDSTIFRPQLPRISTDLPSLHHSISSAESNRPPLPEIPVASRRRSISSQGSQQNFAGRSRSDSNRSKAEGEYSTRVRRSIVEVLPLPTSPPRSSVGWSRFEFGLSVFPNILVRLLHFIDYEEFVALRRLTKTTANLFERSREQEIILSRFLGPFGYRSFGSSKGGNISLSPEISLGFRDLDAFHLVGKFSIRDYCKFATAHLSRPLQTNTLAMIRASTRAWNRVVLRIRLQSTLDSNNPLLLSRPHYLFHSLDKSKTQVVPIHKAGRAALLKVWIPSVDSHFMADKELVECERELWRAGISTSVKRGDIVWNIGMGDDFGNEGKLIFDGRYLRDLQHSFDRVGHVPSWLNALTVSPSYYHNIIASSHSNPVFFLSLNPFLSQIRETLALSQDHVSLSSPQGNYVVKKYVYRATIKIKSGQIIGQSHTETAHDDWVGTLIVETQGTTEHAASLIGRASSVEFSSWRILREKSRAGKIWISPVNEDERIN